MYWCSRAMQAKIAIVILANGMPFTFFATRTIIKAEQMTVTSIWVIQILGQRRKSIEWTNPLNRENLSNIFHFLFLSFIPFLQWSAVRPTVQRHTMLVEYTEHGTSACEATDSEDVINAVPLVVHVHDILLTLQLRQCPFRLLGRPDILLQMDDVCRCLAQDGTLLRE